MTKKQINKTLVKLCKWRKSKIIHGCWTDNEGFLYPTTPDYTQDLNACHEAEKFLTYSQLDLYVTLIYDWAREEARRVSPTQYAIQEPWGQFIVKLSAQKRAEFLALVCTP